MKLQLLLHFLCYLFVICECNEFSIQQNFSESTNTDFYLNSPKIIRKYGYPVEAHVVETADNYLLELHHIPKGKNFRKVETDCNCIKKPPIFIQHGLLGSSADFLLIGPENGLPFILADLGFDVWLGNVRGNTYSRGHASLSPDEKQFWNFTWHQSAIYDLPAQIDFILSYTKQEKLVYIGYSMGTTMFFVLTSTLPKYNEKIEVSMLMAAVGFAKNIKSPLLRWLTPLSEKIKVLDELIENGEFLSKSQLWTIFEKIFCDMSNIEKRLCTNAIFLIVGSDPKEFDEKLLKTLIGHFPSGYSAKAVNHYSQLVKSGKFRQYDYGRERNQLQYGSPTPPDYQIQKIRTPMYFYEGHNDYLSTLKDVKHLAKQLSSLRSLRIIDYPKFSHLDFLLSSDVKKQVYELLLEDLMSFLKIT